MGGYEEGQISIDRIQHPFINQIQFDYHII